MMFHQLRRRRSSFDKSPHVLKTIHKQTTLYNVGSAVVTTKTGLLHKLSRNNKFQLRYFSLSGHYLLYYSSDVKNIDTKKSPAGFVDLNNYAKVYRTNSITSDETNVDNTEDNMYIKIVGFNTNEGTEVSYNVRTDEEYSKYQNPKDVDAIILRAPTYFEAKEWETALANIILSSQNDNNNNTDDSSGSSISGNKRPQYIFDGGNDNNTNTSRYAPLHIELQNNTNNDTVETFGTPLIPPFQLKTIFSMETHATNHNNVNHQLIISFVNVAKDDQACLACKTNFPPSAFSIPEEEGDDYDTDAFNRNVGEISTPLMAFNTNQSDKIYTTSQNVNISWHRQKINGFNDKNISKDVDTSKFYTFVRHAQSLYKYLWDIICVITIPFFYINLYLNMSYVDDQCNITSTLTFLYERSIGSAKTIDSALPNSDFWKNIDKLFLVIVYFWIVQLRFLYMVSYFKTSPMKYKYTFFTLILCMSILFYMCMNNQLSFYYPNIAKDTDSHYCIKLYNKPFCFDLNYMIGQNLNVVIFKTLELYYLSKAWFGGNIYTIKAQIFDNYVIQEIFKWIMTYLKILISSQHFMLSKEYFEIGCNNIYILFNSNIVATRKFISKNHEFITYSESDASSDYLPLSISPDLYLMIFIISTWFIFSILNILYYKSFESYKYTITNIDVVRTAARSSDKQKENFNQLSYKGKKNKVKALTDIQSYERPLIKDFLTIINQWIRTYNEQYPRHPIPKEYREDFMAVKFLRARQFDVDKAVKLFQQCHRWRMNVGANTLATSFLPPDKILQYACPIGLYRLLKHGQNTLPFHLRDKNGHLTLFYRPGLPHWKKLFKCINNDEAFARKCVTWILAMAQKDCLEHYRQTGTPPYATLIFDVGKFSMSKQIPILSALRIAKKLLKDINIGYPETLYKIVFLQSSWVFVKFFELFKPFIPPHLLKKIHIVTEKKAALNYLNKEDVPIYFGGDLEDDKDEAFPSAVRDECPMKCGPGRTYWNKYFEDKGWKSSCISQS